MGKAGSVGVSQDNKIALPELEQAGIFLSPDTVYTSQGSLGIKANIGYGGLNVTQSGLQGADVNELVNQLLSNNQFTNELVSNSVSGAAETLSDRLTDANEQLVGQLAEVKQTETGQFKDMLKEFGIFIVLIVGIFAVFRGKK